MLKAPDVPSVLIELGYVSNKQDLKLMTSDAWRARTADAVAQAVNTFFSARGQPRGRDSGAKLTEIGSGRASLSLTIKRRNLGGSGPIGGGG